MKVQVIGSTNPGFVLDKMEAMKLSGRAAGICYMPDSFDTIQKEPEEKTLKRAKGTLSSGHHSVYDHVQYNLLLVDIPKFLAMILNNEGIYTTSEKSARYTKMKPTEKELVLYNKWYDILKNEISGAYQERFLAYYKDMVKADKAMGKLAGENARYMISVFTNTTMMYTVSLRQLNYILTFFEDYMEGEEETPFTQRVKEAMKAFIEAVPECMKVEGLNAREKERKIAIFDSRKNRREIFSEVYSTTYEGTFAQYAQAQRHRTLEYQMRLLDTPKFYVPELIREDEALSKEWLSDIESVKDLYPQGMLISIRERGTYEKFVLKCKERLCGAAQLEIALQTKKTLDKYLSEVKANGEEEIYSYLLKYAKGARCTFPGFTCKKPCMWGAKDALTRKI